MQGSADDGDNLGGGVLRVLEHSGWWVSVEGVAVWVVKQYGWWNSVGREAAVVGVGSVHTWNL